MLIVIILFIIFLILLRNKGFWSEQPAFHYHDISYYFSSNKVINTNLPEKTKWTDFQNIQTYTRLNERQIVHFVSFIQRNYLTNGANIFSPKRENIMPYFEGHNDKIFVSLFSEDELLLHGQTTIDEKRLVGVLTSRPMRFSFAGGETMNIYYVDYLCVDQMRRKKGYTQKLIKTHEYGQRHLNPKISISLFKREDELSHLVPLTIYKTYGYPITSLMTSLISSKKLNPVYKLVKIGSSNYRLLHEFIEQQSQFEIRIQADIANILALLQTGNIFIYAISLRDQIVCAYFFRKSCVFIDSGREVLSCFASINRDDSVFIDGFYGALFEAKGERFGYLAIEDISNNDELITMMGQAEIVSPTAYYFHNYVCKTIYKNKMFIII
jgi:hypothetical protein